MTNRIIKFRVWSKKDSKFGYIELTDGGEGKPHIRMPKPHITYGTNNVVYQQYTGLKDSKGVEIYEGDIVRHSNRGKAVVEWSPYLACFGFNLYPFYGDGGLPLKTEPWRTRSKFWRIKNLKSVENYEIIGNIYEDSHLLSGDPDKFRRVA